MRPSDVLKLRRHDVRAITQRFRADNPRIFGSVLHGNDCETSDLDILVDVLPSATLFDLGGLKEELEKVLGVRVDVLTVEDLPLSMRAKILAEAQAV